MEVVEVDRGCETMAANLKGPTKPMMMGLSSANDSPKKIQTIDFKFFVSELAQKHSFENISKAFDIKVEEVAEWSRQIDLLQQAYCEKYGISFTARSNHTVYSEALAEQIDVVQVTASGKNGKKCSYNTEFKLRAVAFAETSTNRAAAKHFNVNDKRIREWRKNKDILLTSPRDRRRLRGAGRKPLIENRLEQLLFDWILMLARNGKSVTIDELQEKAVDLGLAALPEGSKFSANKAWIERFLKRYNLMTGDNSVDLGNSCAQTVQLDGIVSPTMVVEELPASPVAIDKADKNVTELTDQPNGESFNVTLPT